MADQTGVDAHTVPDKTTAGELSSDGYTYIAQYIDQNDKIEDPSSATFASQADGPMNGSLTQMEAQQIEAGGLNIVSIFETNGEAVSPYAGGPSNTDAEIVNYLAGGNSAAPNTSQGLADGAEAITSAEAVGQTSGAIYFALDFDPGPGTYTPNAQAAVENYLTGVSQALAGSNYTVGVYGAGQTLAWATTADSATGYTPPAVLDTWLSGSTGWAGYNTMGTTNTDAATHGWSMIQSIPQLTGQSPTAPGTNLEVDYDTGSGNFGAWPVCYAAGNRIRTVRGDVAVEALAVGDLVVTASGEHRPIRWLGHRTVDCRTHPTPKAVWPVRIAAHAFGEGRPARDLVVSPGHAICVDIDGEILIPASSLINGATVVQDEVDTVTYWHIELDSHDILLAEGLPAESYLDCGNRAWFAGGVGLVDPDRAIGSPDVFCRPFVTAGPLVAACRERLAAQAEALGWAVTSDMDLHCVVGGQRIEATVEGDLACVLIPPGAEAIEIASATFKPAWWAGDDDRGLGIHLQSLRVLDGFGRTAEIALDDAALAAGLHAHDTNDSDKARWTSGRLRLPANLWAHCRGSLFLQLRATTGVGRRWIAPAATSEAAIEQAFEAERLRAAA